MTEYTGKLDNIPNDTDFSQDILANATNLTFRFFWPTDIQEIIDDYERALDTRAKADPLIKDLDILRDYEWLDLYLNTIPHTSVSAIQEWLASAPLIPQSLQDLNTPATQDLLASAIYERCMEAEGLWYYLEPLYNSLVWHVEISDNTGDSCSAVVRRGGWINNQAGNWRVQFEADSDIGRGDLGLVTINVEVPEE